MITKYFQMDNAYSLVRLLSFLVVFTGLIISIVILVFILLKTDIIYIRELIYLVGVLLGFGFGAKVVQKFAEKEININQ